MMGGKSPTPLRESAYAPNFLSKPTPEPKPAASGGRIFHVKFGYGVVLRTSGDTLEIAFEKAGIKKVKADFVEKV